MMGRTHQLIGISTTALALLAAGIAPGSGGFVVSLGVGWLASLLPDIDAAKGSKADPLLRQKLGIGDNQTRKDVQAARRRFRRHRNPEGAVNLVDAYLRRGVATGANSVAEYLPHRGITHSLLTCLLLTGLLALLVSFMPAWPTRGLPFAFLVGYVSHLVADGVTKTGIPLLMPLTRHRFHLLPRRLRLTTGGIFEQTLFRLLLIADILLVLGLLLRYLRGFLPV
ncbi:MAG: metal-dependent hydrolase [Anaerolineales bacterium]|nr:metal-dependent hydrolase [Anaerolineales bacterium]